MANRRMFSKTVVNSGRFLRMPQTSRLLYYDLGMAADDDGVVEAFTVIRATGANEDDLRVLVARGFVRILNDDLVIIILDWNENNQIRKDRYIPSKYRNLLDDGNQMATNVQPDGNQMATNGIPSDNQMEPQSRSGKDSLESSSKKPKRFKPPTHLEVTNYCAGRFDNIDPQEFIDFYKARDWMVGGKKMVDWRSVIRKWALNQKPLAATTEEAPRQILRPGALYL